MHRDLPDPRSLRDQGVVAVVAGRAQHPATGKPRTHLATRVLIQRGAISVHQHNDSMLGRIVCGSERSCARLDVSPTEGRCRTTAIGLSSPASWVPRACEAFEGFEIEQVRGDTVLRAELDQAALQGALNRVFALALELVDVTRED